MKSNMTDNSFSPCLADPLGGTLRGAGAEDAIAELATSWYSAPFFLPPFSPIGPDGQEWKILED